MAGVSFKNLTRRTSAPRSAFSELAERILPDWDISLVLLGPAKARELNLRLRGKDYVPNVLSYVAGANSGEIIICPAEAAKQAASYQLSDANFQLYLFIHAALHIKGWDHGASMERCERKLLADYVATHSNRNRRRNVPSKDRRRRGTLR